MSQESHSQEGMHLPAAEPVSQGTVGRRRHIAIVLLAVAVLAMLAMTMGTALPGLSGGLPGPPVDALSTTTHVSPEQAAAPVEGTVTASIRPLGRHTWRFVYTVRNTGSVPIAGFELNAPRSSLFRIWGKTDWNYFGSGVCGSHYGTVLLYWSTGTGGPLLTPHRTAHFGFTVNTTGLKPVGYSLSWSSAHPTFGTVPGPAPSSLPAPGDCSN